MTAENRWRSIDSAPKDDTPILAYLPSNGPWISEICTVRRYEQGGCWLRENDGTGVEASHWMPLPEPPSPAARPAGAEGSAAVGTLARETIRRGITQVIHARYDVRNDPTAHPDDHLPAADEIMVFVDAFAAEPVTSGKLRDKLTDEERTLVEQHREYQAVSDEIWRREGKPEPHGITLLSIVDRLAPTRDASDGEKEDV